jgi:tetratricopeptide (TPR) repeat protein
VTDLGSEPPALPNAAPPPVFISYSSKNGDVANALCAAIEGLGVSVWMAPRNVAPGMHYGESILHGINAAKLMIVVFSSDSNKSGQVLREVERAVSKGMPIITVRIENTLPTLAMEYFLSSQHWLDAFAPPLDQHLRTVADTVRRMAAAGFVHDVPMLKSEIRPHTSIRLPFYPYVISRRAALVGGAGTVAVALAAGATWWATMPRPPDGVSFDPTAVAVLPFANNTGDATLDYLSRALPDEIGRLLTNLTTVAVRPFAEVQRVVQARLSGGNAGLALGVGRVVNGSLAKAGSRLTLGVTISDPVRRQQLWTNDVPADTDHLTDLMGLTVAKIGAVLQKNAEAESVHPSAGSDVDRVRASISSDDDRAYVLYLRALGLQQEITKENIDLAIGHLEEATKLDLQFARAFAALAECYATSFLWGLSKGSGVLDQAQAAADRATLLRTDLAESHYALAMTLEAKGKRKEAIRSYFVSLRANPRYADAVKSVARFLFFMAEFDRSIEMWEALARIDATSNTPRLRKAMCYYFKGDFDRARVENAAAEKFARGVDEFTLIAFTYAWLGDIDAAKRMLERLRAARPDGAQVTEVRAWILTRQKNFKAARADIDRLFEQYGAYYGIQDGLATFYAIQGERERAISLLTSAVKAGAPNYAWYRSDWFKALRGDPRYEAIIETFREEYGELKHEIPKLR